MEKRFNHVLFLALLLPVMLNAQRISVNGNRLEVNGHRIWMNAVNTPWQNWNDFGGNYISDFWDTEFGKIRSYGGNSTRIWITCNGDGPIQIDADGIVTGMTEKFWSDCDDLFSLAEKHALYVMATLVSFDHTLAGNTNYQRFRALYNSDAGIQSFIDNYVIPFVDRYKDKPFLCMVEPCNEIEWLVENPDCGGISWERLQKFCGKVVQAVNTRSQILTTIGCSAKWQGGEINRFKDSDLQAHVSGEGVYIGVYSPHWYDWIKQWYGDPFSDRNPASYGLDDKPAVIGEAPAGEEWVDYQGAYDNGWSGVYAWTSNGVDLHGSLDMGLGIKLQDFYDTHKEIIDVPSGNVSIPGTYPVSYLAGTQSSGLSTTIRVFRCIIYEKA